MATIFIRGKKKVWYISYFLNSRRILKSLKTTDEKLARLLKKEIEVKVKRGTQQDIRKIKIETYFQEYLKDTGYRKKATNKNELYTIKGFLRATGKKTVSGINTDDVWMFMREYEGKAARTFNNVLAALKRFFRLAVTKGYVLKNPCEGIHHKRTPQSLPHFFTDEEYMRIEQSAEGSFLFPMIVTARYTGLRLRELIHLEWQDFKWDLKLIWVLNKPKFNHTVKNFQTRVVPVSGELRDKLLPYIKESGICFPVPLTGEKYSDDGPKRSLKTILKKADLCAKRIGWHEFRHTFASRLVQNNVPIYKVSKWLGHSSLAVTQIYAHFAPVYDLDIEKLILQNRSTAFPITL